MSRSIFDYLPTGQPSTQPWTPRPLPLIASKGITEVCLNFETTGLLWFENDEPLSFAIDYPTDNGYQSDYFAWGHASGNNITKAQAVEWLQTELKGTRISNINTRFEIHHGRKIGVDFEQMGCTLGDVGHQAALLDDHRQRSSLDALAYDYFGKIEVPRLDETRMKYHPAPLAAPRAMYNVQLVRRLRDVFAPELQKQDLGRVQKLEERLIYVVCEMERNGAPLDVALLERWNKRSWEQICAIRKEVAELTGRRVQQDLFGDEQGHLNPDSPKDMVELFKLLGLPITTTATGRPSFKAEVLKRVDHPVIRKIEAWNRLIELRSRFITNYLERVGSDGILRYALHQLRAVKDPTSESEAGTVTGRFSSTEITKGVGVNIQQVIKTAKQRIAWGYDEDDDSHDDEIYLIRQLFRPAEGQWLSADAMQIEYRLFANEVNDSRINEQFQKDPKTSFHKFTHAIFKQKLPDLTYRRMKDINFAKIYAAGPSKIAFMLGYITGEQLAELQAIKAKRTHPLLKETAELLKVYDQEIPGAAGLIREASELAKNRGYIKSILGRRQRFPDGQRLHKALNSRIQPSAADIMKTKLVELHENREWTQFLLRYTVHDEVDGDAQHEEETRERVAQILDSQSFDFRIPILWDTNIGKNWKEAA